MAVPKSITGIIIRWGGVEVVKTILKRDVFVILPTGFGKGACYQCLPLTRTSRTSPRLRSMLLH